MQPIRHSQARISARVTLVWDDARHVVPELHCQLNALSALSHGDTVSTCSTTIAGLTTAISRVTTNIRWLTSMSGNVSLSVNLSLVGHYSTKIQTQTPGNARSSRDQPSSSSACGNDRPRTIRIAHMPNPYHQTMGAPRPSPYSLPRLDFGAWQRCSYMHGFRWPQSSTAWWYQ